MSSPEYITPLPNGSRAISNQDNESLKRIAQDILDPEKTIVDLIPHIGDLRALLERHTLLKLMPEANLGEGRTILDSGMAVSPLMAAFCAREVLRSAAFIKGAGAAVQDAAREDRPVQVLYAGCGPFALLVLPLMSVFSAQQVVFTLIDIHPESLSCAQHLIESFGFSDHVLEYVCADATRYRTPPNHLPDVIVSETMAVCLRNEPQVSIARNLLSQAPNARMVPQSVSIEVALLNGPKELVLMPSDHVGDIPLPKRDRVYLGTVFELDADSIRSWEGLAGDRLPAGNVTLPTPLESRYRPHLLTRITAYGQHRLQDYDCSLTLPQHLSDKHGLCGGETLQFHYKIGTCPELVFEIQRQ